MFIPTTTLQAASPVGQDGWVNDTAATWTRTAATTFTVTGDRTLEFSKGTRLRLKQGAGYLYFVVVLSSHAAGTTTVTVTAGSDYTLAAAAITDNYYSYGVNPQGYPGWFNHTATITGFTSAPTPDVSKFEIVGRTCTFDFATPASTSNATTFTVTAPVAPAVAHSNGWTGVRTYDNGAFDADLGIFIASGATLTLGRSGQSLGWTASGGKAAMFCVSYEI